MKRDKEFSNILDECLERLLVRGETVEQCLEKYPEHAAELEPLLKTAAAASKALAIQPAPEFKARARYELRSVLEKTKPEKRVPFLIWQPRWAMTMVIFLAVVVAGGGTVVAADSDRTVSGNPLYPVKLATEQVRVALTPSDIGKAELYAALADRRVAEIAYIVDKGKPWQIERTTQRLNEHLAKMHSLHLAAMTKKKAAGEPARAPVLREEAEADSEMTGRRTHAQTKRQARFRVVLGHYAVNHPAKLRALLERAPESAKPALQRAIAVSVASYEQALEDLD